MNKLHSELWRTLFWRRICRSRNCHSQDTPVRRNSQNNPLRLVLTYQQRYQQINIRNRLEVGIAIGCSGSLILFFLAMQLLLKVTENIANIVELGGGFQMPPLKVFMNDMILSLMDKQIIWCKIKLSPKGPELFLSLLYN